MCLKNLLIAFPTVAYSQAFTNNLSSRIKLFFQVLIIWALLVFTATLNLWDCKYWHLSQVYWLLL